MKTALLHQQHCKCVKALELIATCDQYISTCKANLKRHYAADWIDQMPGVQKYNQKNIEKYSAIKQRLIIYYSNQFMKMVSPVAELISE